MAAWRSRRSIGVAARRLWPVALVLVALALAYAAGVQRVLSVRFLGQQQQALHAFADARPVLALASYVAIYAVAVALSLPGSVVLTLAGGLLFGTAIGAAAAAVGATTGAMLLFLAARSSLGEVLARRAGPLMDRIRPGLQRDGFSCVLALRLLPVVPFWLVNLAAALVGVRPGPFVLATAIGIIPATVVFASVGAGLGSVLAAGGEPDLSVIARPAVILPLLGLAALSLLPVAWRRWKPAGG